jgi:hypothetical protein
VVFVDSFERHRAAHVRHTGSYNEHGLYWEAVTITRTGFIRSTRLFAGFTEQIPCQETETTHPRPVSSAWVQTPAQ